MESLNFIFMIFASLMMYIAKDSVKYLLQLKQAHVYGITPNSFAQLMESVHVPAHGSGSLFLSGWLSRSSTAIPHRFIYHPTI